MIIAWLPCWLTLVALTTLQVIRIQPDEAIYLKINNKIPGLGLRLDSSKLDLTYKARYNTHLPDAYERLILDVINGDKRLFIRNDELEAAWALFTPILKVRFLQPTQLSAALHSPVADGRCSRQTAVSQWLCNFRVHAPGLKAASA